MTQQSNSETNGIPEKRYRLRTGMILEIWPADPRDDEVKRVFIYPIRGQAKGVINFVAEDVQTIIDALNDALNQPQAFARKK